MIHHLEAAIDGVAIRLIQGLGRVTRDRSHITQGTAAVIAIAIARTAYLIKLALRKLTTWT